MRAHFPDTKSAALACEQIVSAGYPLSHFALQESAPARKVPTQPVVSGSLWKRLLRVFGVGSAQPEPGGADPSHASLSDFGDPAGETILFSTDAVDAVIRSIIVQHGGYLEPPSAQPSDNQPAS